nr:glycosyltransferase [Candidatus Sigynarchaeota archaeon]
MVRKQKLWITTFEFGPEKLGGLGEVPTNQVKQLQDDVDITVLMPAHGLIHGATAKKVQTRSIGYDLDFTQRFKGMVDDPKNNILDGYPDEAPVKIIPYVLNLPGTRARVIAFSGEDGLTRKILDDPVIYSMTCLKCKIAVFSRALREFVDHEAALDNVPDCMHVHDYHAVPGILGSRQVLLNRGLDAATIFTVHLLTGPKVTMDYLACCGVSDATIPFTIKGARVDSRVSDLVQLAKNRLEFIAAYMADVVTSVSKTYLIENVIPNCGADLLDGKTDFIHNGCDWNFDEISKSVQEASRSELTTFLGKKIDKQASRADLRRFLTTWKLGHLPPSEPAIDDPELLKVVKKFDGVDPYIENSKVKNFPADAKLCLITGRASKQKGIEIVFDAIPSILKEYPTINFLFSCLPTQGEKALIADYCQRATNDVIKNHVRFIWGKADSIFRMAHLVADIYLAPSRWEPFGIMVLESNAVGLPVIGAGVGGIKETIVDVASNPEEGTGMVIEKESPSALATAVLDMVHAIDASEAKDRARLAAIAASIKGERFRNAVIKNPGIYEAMRVNARKRVEQSFRWKIVAKKELELMSRANRQRELREGR